MSELYDKSIRTLELPAVLEVLAQKAVSEAARERCRKLYPSSGWRARRRTIPPRRRTSGRAALI